MPISISRDGLIMRDRLPRETGLVRSLLRAEARQNKLHCYKALQSLTFLILEARWSPPLHRHMLNYLEISDTVVPIA